MTRATVFADPQRRRRRSVGNNRSERSDWLPARRTLLALLASGLGILPLKALFLDTGWLIDVWLTMIVVIAPAALIRRRRAPGALDVWPGIILLVPWLTARFLGDHAIAGFIPTTATSHDLARLMNSLHETTRDESAPIHTTVAVRLVICALLGLLAALVDLIAVVGRRAALAGVPLLVVYTVSGAVPREPVSWVWFVFAAIGYLILLSVDAGDDLRTWGLRVHNPGSGRARGALAVSTQRIAVAAIVVAVLLPLLVPGESRNLIANAFHNGGNGDGVGGFGEGSGTAGISPYAALQGQLTRADPVELLQVHMSSVSETQPFYMRVNVLSKYSDDGWSVADHGTREDLDSTNFATQPQGDGSKSDLTELDAQIKITNLAGSAPIFAVPIALDGVDTDTKWSPLDQLILGSKASRGQVINERFAQLTPTVRQLRDATDEPDSLADLRTVPGGLPDYAQNLLNGITAGKTSTYEKALAISDFFANPNNGFTYDLRTQQGDSPSALVNFLRNRVGYCQQYAAAEAVLMRASGIPTRVVLGYMHSVPDRNGNFSVTTSDAHSWVEAYFGGIGWVPFDPTPAAGLTGGKKNDLSYAPHVYPNDANNGNNRPNADSSSATTPATQPQAAATAAPGTTASRNTGSSLSVLGLWPFAVAILVIAVALTPAFVRARRRRRRYAAGRREGDTDALWAELSDTATDLGYVWSPARSPRQVADWLARDVSNSAPALRSLATAVEQLRYSPPAAGAADGDRLAGELRDVTGAMRSGRNGRTRFRALLFPSSLGWTALWRDRLARRH